MRDTGGSVHTDPGGNPVPGKLHALLLGSGGMLARDLVGTAPPNVVLTAPPEAQLDITSEPDLVRACRAVDPDVIINAAAYTNVDGAESNRGVAFTVNGQAPGTIGYAAKTVGATVLHYSTDYVFSGATRRPYRESDEPAPLGVYGASKLAGEVALAASGANHLILRTQWLFGVAGRSFPRTMWERASDGLATRVVNDQVGRPTFSRDLASATWRLLLLPTERVGNGTRVLHVANTGTATWYDVALRVFEARGATHLVEPCSTEEYPTPAARPAWSVLHTAAVEALLGAPLPNWEDALDRLLVVLGEKG